MTSRDKFNLIFGARLYLLGAEVKFLCTSLSFYLRILKLNCIFMHCFGQD